MDAVSRVVITTDPHDPQSWQLACALASGVCTQSSPPSQDVVLLTHTDNQMRQTSLPALIGAAGTKSLLSGGNVSLPGGGSLRHATMRTAGRSLGGAVVIAYYADRALLEFLDGVAGLKAVIAVPDEDIESWKERWNPIVQGQSVQAPARLIDDPVCEKALEWLTGMASGKPVMDPRDKERADETLRILRAKGHAFEPEKIQSWAIRNGWQTQAAQELADMARRIGGLARKPALTAFHDAEGNYARWTV